MTYSLSSRSLNPTWAYLSVYLTETNLDGQRDNLAAVDDNRFADRDDRGWRIEDNAGVDILVRQRVVHADSDEYVGSSGLGDERRCSARGAARRGRSVSGKV